MKYFKGDNNVLSNINIKTEAKLEVIIKQNEENEKDVEEKLNEIMKQNQGKNSPKNFE